MSNIILLLQEGKRTCIHCKSLFIPVNYHQRVCDKKTCPVYRKKVRLRSKIYRESLSFEDKFIRMIVQNKYNFSYVRNSWIM